MGYEIKNICTVAPNEHHPGYSDPENKYAYFSVFITPRLQFDGRLKEFYEMLNWPLYTSIFQPKGTAKNPDSVFLAVKGAKKIQLEVDTTYTLIPVSANRGKQIDITENRQRVWKKLFKEDTPVTAWPLYLKPQREKARITVTQVQDYISQDAGATPLVNSLFQGSTSTMSAVIANTLTGKEPPPQATPAQTAFVEKKIDELKSARMKELYENTKISQEFHKKISALSRYPHLLRIMGLIYDFKILQSDLALCLNDMTALDTMIIRLQFGNISTVGQNNSDVDFDEFSKSVQFICPYTRIDPQLAKDNKRLAAFSRVHPNPSDAKLDYKNFVADGFVNPEKITVNQDYLENMTENIAEKTKDQASNVAFNGKIFSIEDLEVIRSRSQNLVSKGLSIKIASEPEDLLTNMDQALNNLTDETIEWDENAFEAHHLHCGYRIDIGDADGANWRSLCRRVATYNIDTSDTKDKQQYAKFVDMIFDEPWVEEVRQVNNDGSLNRFEEVARWNNWSLTCPPLHADNKAGKKDADKDEYNDLTLTDIRPVGLPKLRFGQDKYSLRIRVADICGNGVDAPTANGFRPADTTKSSIVGGNKKEAISYRRLEPLQAPQLFPAEKISWADKHDKTHIDPDFAGEGPDTLIIRTQIDAAGNPKALQDRCVRYVIPCHIAPHLAEVSGIFDPYWFPGDGHHIDNLYDWLKTNPPDHFAGTDIDGKQIPFVFDPLVADFSLSDDDPRQNAGAAPHHHDAGSFPECPSPNHPPDILRDTRAVALSLREGDVGFSANTFFLPKGNWRAVWIHTSDGSAPDASGHLSSDPKKITLIHAVQRPVLANGTAIKTSTISLADLLCVSKVALTANSLAAEKYHVTIAPFDKANKKKIGESMPASTVGEYVVSAQYSDYILDPASSNGYSILATPHIIRKSFNNHDADAEEGALTTVVRDEHDFDRLVEKDTPGSSYIQQFVHSYPDTRQHKVYYRISAISKFLNYFNEKSLPDKENAFEVTLDLGEQVIQNSSKPSKPGITSTIPLFEVVEPTGRDGTYTFKPNGFRLYLGKIWYETGLDEKIAVIFARQNPTDLAENDIRLMKIDILANDPTVDSIAQHHTIVGNDPFVTNVVSHPVNGRSLSAADTLDIGLFPRKVEDTVAIPGVARGITAVDPYEYSAFPVEWDMNRQQFFADITLSQLEKINYSALIKLAVCRYQKESLFSKGQYDYRFSDVVMSDMVTLLPQRSITIQKDKLTIDLHDKPGTRYNGEKFLPNQFYLLCEKKTIGPNITAGRKEGLDTTTVIRLDTLSYEMTGFAGKYDRVMLEEYEQIRLDDQPVNHLYVPPENPRNDPAKRLVFFYPVV